MQEIENLLKTNNYKSYLEFGPDINTSSYLAQRCPNIIVYSVPDTDRDGNWNKIYNLLATAPNYGCFQGLTEEFFASNKKTYDVIHFNNNKYSYNMLSLDFCETKRIINSNGIIIINGILETSASKKLWKDIKHKDCWEIGNLGIWKKMKQVKLEDVTLVLSVYKNYNNIEPIMETMLAECICKRNIILTPDKVESPYENILMPDMSLADYSIYVMKQLIADIKLDTEFILFTQTDGFVIDGTAWKSEFLDYDYIGAPWPEHVSPQYRVGNGGFSLRSKKLMTILQDNKYPAQHPEDAQICRVLRPFLEKENIKFAPPEIAEWFSCESTYKAHQTFGFHSPIEIRYYLSYKYKNLWFLI